MAFVHVTGRSGQSSEYVSLLTSLHEIVVMLEHSGSVAARLASRSLAGRQRSKRQLRYRPPAASRGVRTCQSRNARHPRAA